MKTLVKLVVVLVLLAVIAAVAGVFYIDSLAKAAIERGGTYALGVDTTVGSADVGIMSGSFSMSGLDVANPDGYATAYLLHLDEGSAAVDLATLRRDIVELPSLALSGVNMNLERGEGTANYQVILENLKRFESGDKPKDEDGKRFIIKEVKLDDIGVNVSLLPGGDVTRLDLEIDEIVLVDVGSESGRGVLLSELAGTLIKAILQAVARKGGHLIPTDMLGDLQGQLAQLQSLSDLGIGMLAIEGGEVEAIVGQLSQFEGLEGIDLDNILDLGGDGDVKEKVGDALGDILGDGDGEDGDVKEKVGEAIGDLLGGDDDDDG